MHRTPLEQFALADATFGVRARGDALTRYSMTRDGTLYAFPPRPDAPTGRELVSQVGPRRIATLLPFDASPSKLSRLVEAHRTDVRQWIDRGLGMRGGLASVPVESAHPAPVRANRRAFTLAEAQHRRVEVARAFVAHRSPDGRGVRFPLLWARDVQARVTSHHRDATRTATDRSAARMADTRARRAAPTAEDNGSAALAVLREAAIRAMRDDAHDGAAVLSWRGVGASSPRV